MKVLILDEIVVKPGCAAQYRAAYRQRYMPAARRRGMSLAGEWQNPPLQDFDELEMTLFFLWSVDGVDGWWQQRFSRMPDGSDERFEKHAFWQSVAAMTVSRRRLMLSDQPEAA